MAEYINRERARFEAKRYFKNLDEIQEDLDMLFCMLPAEDVAPVRHGRWVKIYENGEPAIDQHQVGVFCSYCTKMPKDKFTESVFCPNCGSKMDGGANNDRRKNIRRGL